ncbi:MAG: CPBP family intramembrane metalloprotease [Candidatus Methanoperedens sp.]|nr:CPBP family intramembrane metalloprotease [Candidatus Methanoperedens sp.]
MKKYESVPIILIFIAEALLFSGYKTGSIAVHSLNILFIISIVILKKDIKLVQALSLVSLFRIISTSMPVFFSLTIYWFASLYGIMFFSIALIIKDQGLRPKDIGITLKGSWLWPFAVLLGAGLALIEYRILVPGALIPGFTAIDILELGLVMFFFVGLVEELIFRSVLQQRLEESIGMTNGLLVAGVIFGLMHSGFSNYYEILFASFAGFVLGFCFQRTRSLPFVVIAHSVNNIILFGILPFL